MLVQQCAGRGAGTSLGCSLQQNGNCYIVRGVNKVILQISVSACLIVFIPSYKLGRETGFD